MLWVLIRSTQAPDIKYFLFIHENIRCGYSLICTVLVAIKCFDYLYRAQDKARLSVEMYWAQLFKANSIVS